MKTEIRELIGQDTPESRNDNTPLEHAIRTAFLAGAMWGESDRGKLIVDPDMDKCLDCIDGLLQDTN